MTRPRKPDRTAKKAEAKDARLEKARNRAKRAAVRPWEPTPWQAAAREAFREVDVLALCGPPGTAKTATATWLAVEEFLAGRVKKIYLLRPAVEAGERLGFLPGGPADKVGPFLTPVLEFIRSLGLSGSEMVRAGTLDVVPVAYAQGRTFHSGVVLADECQNLTRKQLRMLVGRLGANAKMILTGDPAQSEIPESPNAYQTFVAKLKLAASEHCRLFELTDVDILRHAAVPELLRLCE